jgi:hypothetical protein
MHNLNNFILMISFSRLKNAVDKNFIELQNQNIINMYKINKIKKNDDKHAIIKINENKNNLEEKNNVESKSFIDESNFLFNSFIHVATDSFHFDWEDWNFIYKNE